MVQVSDPLPKSLYDIICCPICKADLKYTVSKKSLRCSSCDKLYAILDGVPVLLP